MATHSNILAWRITWTGEFDGLQSMGWGGGEAGHKELDTTEVTEHACVQYMENYPNLLTLFGFYFNILLLLCQIHILIHSV